MKRRRAAAALLCAALALGIGCKRETPPMVSLGSFEVSMAGSVNIQTEQLPLTAMGLGVSTPLVITVAQSTPESAEVYIAIAVEWEQTLTTLRERRQQAWDEGAFTGFVHQTILESMMLGLNIDSERTAQYGGLEGRAHAFSLAHPSGEAVADWSDTRGEAVSFMSNERLIMLIYAAEAPSYSADNREAFFQSLILRAP